MLNPFDLLFVALFFASIITLVTAAVAALRKRRAQAFRILGLWTLCALTYLAIVCAVSFATSQKTLAIGNAQCNGEWCIAVQNASRTPSTSGVTYDVNLRIFTTARRVAMREKGVSVYLTDSLNRHFDPVASASDVPLDSVVAPGESVIAHRAFQLPPGAQSVGLVVAYDSGLLGCAPGCLVITENQWFHKPPVVRLD